MYIYIISYEYPISHVIIYDPLFKHPQVVSRGDNWDMIGWLVFVGHRLFRALQQ